MTGIDDMSDVTLKELFEVRITALEKAMETASKIIDTRLESMNHFRQENLCDKSKYVTKEWYEAKHESLQRQVDDLLLSRAELKGKASMISVYLAYLLTALSIGLSIISVVHGFMK